MTVDIRKQLPLEDVEYKDGQATLTFMDMNAGEIVPVKLSINKFNPATKKREEDAEQEQRTRKVCKEYFNEDFENLTKAIGQEHDIYVYDRFASLYEVDLVEKFTKEQEGEIIMTTIEEVFDDGNAIKIRFLWDGNKYESKMSYSDYKEKLQKYFVNPIKRKTQFTKFEEKFGVPVESAEKIIGKEITVEVKVAFGKFAYAEIKNPKWS